MSRCLETARGGARLRRGVGAPRAAGRGCSRRRRAGRRIGRGACKGRTNRCHGRLAAMAAWWRWLHGGESGDGGRSSACSSHQGCRMAMAALAGGRKRLGTNRAPGAAGAACAAYFCGKFVLANATDGQAAGSLFNPVARPLAQTLRSASSRLGGCRMKRAGRCRFGRGWQWVGSLFDVAYHRNRVRYLAAQFIPHATRPSILLCC